LRLNGTEQIGEDACDEALGISGLEALVRDATRLYNVVLVGRHIVAAQALGGARQGTAVERDDLRSRARGGHGRRFAGTDRRNAAHARKAALRELHGHVVHHLARA
jgi:hypothetical protein